MENNIYGKISLENGKPHYFSIGDLHLWLDYRDKEIWIAHEYEDDSEGEMESGNPPQSLEWARWAHKIGSSELRILPVYPDLPLVVHSKYALKVSPQTTIQIYTRIPIWLRISLADMDYRLIELPAVKLSRTWFGTPTEGELCYHATTKARRDMSQVKGSPYLVSCPIKIANRSSEELKFENFCFRVGRLSMYEHEGEYWADETQIIFQGGDHNSDVIMTGKLAEGISKKQLISRPRKEVHKSLATRTFKLFEDALTFGR